MDRAECDVLGMPSQFVEFVPGAACEGGEGARKRRSAYLNVAKQNFGPPPGNFSAQDNQTCL
jgi:hypothetical protein